MCGFAGVFSSQSLLKDEVFITLEKMKVSLNHRGPDDNDTKIFENCGLTHSRLKIIDLSKFGRQPLSNSDDTIWIVYNGEVYNFKNLKNKFLLNQIEYPFKSKTDTEVILYLYQKEGPKCFETLNGMFSFALLDMRINKLFLVRDRYGTKPLFYTLLGNQIWFASEIKTLLNIPNFNYKPSEEALYHYLSLGYIPGSLTAFEEVMELEPGHVLSVERDGFQINKKKYFTPNYNFQYDMSEDEIVQETGRLLKDSVQKHLISDVPVGVMLSGGLDSSSIVALMAEIRGNSNFHTFGIAFEEESFDESFYSNLVAKHVGTQHHQINVSHKSIREYFEKYISYIDEPYADGSAIPTFLLAKKAKEYVTVLLSGEGGDEVFAGYDTYAAFKVRKLYRYIPKYIRVEILKKIIQKLPVSTDKLSFEFKAKRFVDGANLDLVHSHFYWRHILSDDLKSKLLKENINFDYTYKLFVNKFNEMESGDELSRLMYIDFNFHLADDLMVKNDRMTMAHSLEARVPFTDNKLFNFLNRVPSNIKLKNFNKKYLLKEAMKDYLPKKVLKKKKVGLEIPYSKWFKKELRDLVYDTLSKKSVKNTNFFKFDEVEKLIKNHMNDNCDNGRQIWTIMNYINWYNKYF